MSLFCPACVDMEQGSTFVRSLNDGPIAQPGVTYTVIATQDATVVTPPESQFIDEPGVTNMFVQNVCPGVVMEHENMTRRAHRPARPQRPDPDAAQPVSC